MKQSDFEKQPRNIQDLLRLNGYGAESAIWLGDARGSLTFLKANARSGKIVIYASMRYVLIHCVLALTSQLEKAGQKDLGHGFVQTDTTWRIQHVSGGGEPDKVYLEGPLDGESEAVKGGEKLIYRRSWPGEKDTPLELSQKLVHALDLYWVEHRQAYCRIDRNGDIEEVINVTHMDTGHDYSGTVVTIDSQDLFEFARLADMSLYFFYDFTRTTKDFTSWSGVKRFSSKVRDLFYQGGALPGYASFMNGRQIVRPPIALEAIIKRKQEIRSPAKRRYAKFLAKNRWDGKVITASCDPAKQTSYFEADPKKPLQITPVFFRAEVLLKYKMDPTKYDLSSRSVSCRGAWNLKTFDVNEQGQVHTYLCYLGDLPHAEQVYWQSFNEAPRAGLSKRAIQTDLKGEWSEEYDPVEAVRRMARELDGRPPPWWQPRGEDAIRTLHLPITKSDAEWSEAILVLDQMLVEGLLVAPLRKIAKGLGVTVDDRWQSLRVIEECLVGLGYEPEDAKAIVSPLAKLHGLRSIVKGHATSTKKKAAIVEALRFGSFRGHFEATAADCDQAMKIIIEKLEPATRV